MSEAFALERRRGVTTIRISRHLELAEFLDVVDEVAALGTDDRRLWDLRVCLNYPANEMRIIAARARRHWPGHGRVAYVASGELSYGLMRMFQVFREEEGYQSRVFRDAQDAEVWL